MKESTHVVAPRPEKCGGFIPYHHKITCKTAPNLRGIGLGLMFKTSLLKD